jgi:hypothetical protein
MAEIVKDIYSLEFDSAGFESQISEAIARVEELQGAMQETAGSTEELDNALASLEDVLKKDAKGVEGLNEKQKVLASTQKTLNKDSAAYTAVSKENVKTQKQLSQATADATKNNKSLGGSFLDGAKKINSVKRAVGVLSGAFRLLGALNPLTFALSALPTVIGFFQGLVGGANKAQAALEKLNDPNLGLQERANILKEEIDRLDAVAARTGSLTEEEKKQRDELQKKYQETADEIVKIEEDRINRITDLQNEAARLRVKLLGDTVAGVTESFRVESNILGQEAGKRQAELFDELNKLAQESARLRDAGDFEGANNLQKRIALIQEEQDNINDVLKLRRAQLKQERDNALNNIAQKTIEERKKAEKEAADFTEALLQEERDLRARINSELESDALDFFGNIAAQNSLIPETVKKTNQQIIEENKALYEEEIDLFNAQAERKLALQALEIEKQRNQELAAAVGNSEEQEAINKKFDKRRAQIDNQANQEILKNRIKLLKLLQLQAQSLGLDTTQADKDIAELEAKLQELQRPDPIKLEVETEEPKKKIGEILAGIQDVSDSIFGLLSQQAANFTARLDEAVERSRSALDNIRQNSEDFNADQLALEKRRLLELEEARRQAARREQAIAQIQIVANAALAIAKAAAEGGIAAPFTIASTIISLIAGFAAARNAASGAFFTGTEYLELNGAKKGRDTIHIRAHEGERIVPTANNMQYWDAYSAMQNELIPAPVANIFAKGYLKGGISGAINAVQQLKTVGVGSDVNLRAKLGGAAMFFFANGQDAGLKEEIRELKAALNELPKRMPVSTFNVDSHGLYMTQKRFLGKQEMRKNRAK